MYNALFLSNRIKELAKLRNVTVKTMLKECDLNINIINQTTDKKGMSSFSLAKIADYLDCSVDYLLGRTDNVGTAPSPLISAYNNASDEIKAAVRKLLDMDK